jgi:hypothetical protein
LELWSLELVLVNNINRHSPDGVTFQVNPPRLAGLGKPGALTRRNRSVMNLIWSETTSAKSLTSSERWDEPQRCDCSDWCNYASGWVFSDFYAIDRLIAKRDGQTIAETSFFYNRPDVAAAYPI